MENQELNTEKNLALISEMIASTRNKISEDGFHVIFWGVLLVICCLVQYVMIKFFSIENESNYVWSVLPILGVPFSIWYGRKHSKDNQVKTFVDEFYKYIWIGFGISLFCVISISIAYQHSPTSFIMILMGFAVFVAGVILKFKPLIFGAIVFWISSFIYFYAQNYGPQLLVFAISIILGYIVPGILLRKQYKSQ
jgi:hypothetical protein